MDKVTRVALLAGIALAFTTPTAQAAPVTIGGAPHKAEVELTSSILGFPPDAYALGCTGVPECTATGLVDLAVNGELTVTRDPETGSITGSGPLAYTLIQGEIRREVACKESPPWVSTMTPNGSKPGELAVTDMQPKEGTHELAVTLNHAGLSGEAYPLEIGEHATGGCGMAPDSYTLDHPLWYSTFNFAHQDEWPEDGSVGVVVDGFTWDAGAGAFVKEYDRPVTVQFGLQPSRITERTRIEVRPEFCRGVINRVASATVNGESLGMDGMPFFRGQVVTVPKGSLIRLADGSYVELDRGGSFKITECDESGAQFTLTAGAQKVWTVIKKFLAGSERKFEIRTQRAVAGVRGTKYLLTYDPAKQLTRVAVREGVVSLRGINGARGRILIRAGQVGVQQGKKRPRLVKR